MGTKQSLYKANRVKDDEFYTLYEDVANEVALYKEQLKEKEFYVLAIGMKVITKKLFYKEEGLLLHLIY